MLEPRLHLETKTLSSGSMKKVLCIDSWPQLKPICGSGLGSSLFKLAAFEDAKSCGFEIHLQTSQAKKDLLSNSPTLQKIYVENEEIDYASFDAIIPLGISQARALLQTEKLYLHTLDDRGLKSYYNEVPHLYFWREYLSQALGYTQSTQPAKFPLEIPQEEIRLLDTKTSSLNEPSDIISISISALTPLKKYPHWDQVILKTSQARPHSLIILLGQDSVDIELPNNVLNLTQKTTFKELIAVLHRSSLVLGTDGLITNLAMVLGVPTITLFTIIRPDFVIDPDQEKRSPAIPLVQGDCPLQFCYSQLGNYRTATCPYEPELPEGKAPICTQIAPEVILEEILSRIPG